MQQANNSNTSNISAGPIANAGSLTLSSSSVTTTVSTAAAAANAAAAAQLLPFQHFYQFKELVKVSDISYLIFRYFFFF
jgi:hypothetical protein